MSYQKPNDRQRDFYIRQGMKSFYENRGSYLNPYKWGSDEFNDFERGWTQALKRCPGHTFNKYNL